MRNTFFWEWRSFLSSLKMITDVITSSAYICQALLSWVYFKTQLYFDYVLKVGFRKRAVLPRHLSGGKKGAHDELKKQLWGIFLLGGGEGLVMGGPARKRLEASHCAFSLPGGAGNMGSGQQTKGNLSPCLGLSGSKPRHETFEVYEGSCRRLQFQGQTSWARNKLEDFSISTKKGRVGELE